MVEIREMGPDDVEAAVELANQARWLSRRAFYQLALSLPTCTGLVAVDGGRVVATGVGTVSGPVGWIGTILVAEDRRRQGLGRAITEAVCDRLEAAGCATLALIATELGRPLYEALGFEIQSHYHQVEAEPLPDAPAPPPGTDLRPLRPADLPAILELDRLATGEDRRALVEALAGSGWVLEDASGLRGFLLESERGYGPIIGPRAGDARCLLDLHRHLVPAGVRPRAVVLDENVAGLRLLAEHGWHESWSAPRMLRGPAPAWRPAAIWGVFSFAMG